MITVPLSSFSSFLLCCACAFFSFLRKCCFFWAAVCVPDCFVHGLKQPLATDFRGIKGAENAPVIPRFRGQAALLALKGGVRKAFVSFCWSSANLFCPRGEFLPRLIINRGGRAPRQNSGGGLRRNFIFSLRGNKRRRVRWV